MPNGSLSLAEYPTAMVRLICSKCAQQVQLIAHQENSIINPAKPPEQPMVKIRFTDAAIFSLKPRKVRYDVQDSEDTGLLLRVSPQGRKTWMVNYRSDTGIKQQKALGKFPTMRVAEARQVADLALNQTQGSAD